jgi:hypothetical protein
MADHDLSGCTLGEFVVREQIESGGYGAVDCSGQTLRRMSTATRASAKMASSGLGAPIFASAYFRLRALS